MGLRYRKSIKISKGVRINFSKSGVGVSAGRKGCRYSVHSSGRRTATIGIPGSGLYYTTTVGGNKRSYNSNAQLKRQQIQKQKLEMQKQKENELRENSLLVEEYNNYIELITNVHRECREKIDWQIIYQAPAPFEVGQKGELEIEAQRRYDEFKPRLYEKLIASLGEKRKQKLYDAITKAKLDDQKAYENWNDMHQFSETILAGNIDSYLMVIEETNPFEDMADYGSDFEFGTENKESMEIEFLINSEDVVPKVSMSLTSTGKLSKKSLSKTRFFDYMQDYVCSSSIRLAREIFAILPVKYVLVHAVDKVLDSATGYETVQTVLSVRFERSGFEQINFNAIDASDFVETFENNMKFMKTSGFKKVERLN